MALEDRCSPQSAPSPPGVPHSPQSSSSSTSPASASSPFILDMSLQNYSIYSNYHHHHHQSTESSQFLHKMALPVQHFNNHHTNYNTTTHLNTKIKQEIDETNLIIENDHNTTTTDADNHYKIKTLSPAVAAAAATTTPATINFSISNILSDNFGHSIQTKQQNMKNDNSIDKKPIFRPFEVMTTASTSNTEDLQHRSAFKRLATIPNANNSSTSSTSSQLSTPILYDFNQAPSSYINSRAAAAAAAAVMLAERANFINNFNTAAYPRIHQEIINNTKKVNQPKNSNKKAANKSIIGSPSLGSLCKTVAQIGQNHKLSLNSPISESQPLNYQLLSNNNTDSQAIPSTVVAAPRQDPRTTTPPPPSQSISRDSGMESSDDTRSENNDSNKDENGKLWPAWVYCTRYSDRPSSGPRYRRPKQPKDPKTATINDEKRPRTAFSGDQLVRLKREFNENRYLTERRRQSLSNELGLNEAQIKIWFQNKRAKIKKTSGSKNPLALQLMAQGLYNHSTVPLTEEEEELEMRMNGQL